MPPRSTTYRIRRAKDVLEDLYPVKACEDPKCPGWGHFESGRGEEIERCDICKRFPDDDIAAIAHAVDCGCAWGIDYRR